MILLAGTGRYTIDRWGMTENFVLGNWKSSNSFSSITIIGRRAIYPARLQCNVQSWNRNWDRHLGWETEVNHSSYDWPNAPFDTHLNSRFHAQQWRDNPRPEQRENRSAVGTRVNNGSIKYFGRIFPMEIATRYNLVRINQNQWIICRAIHFCRNNFFRHFDCVPRNAMDLEEGFLFSSPHFPYSWNALL